VPLGILLLTVGADLFLAHAAGLGSTCAHGGAVC
jgi:hypothetical protein